MSNDKNRSLLDCNHKKITVKVLLKVNNGDKNDFSWTATTGNNNVLKVNNGDKNDFSWTATTGNNNVLKVNSDDKNVVKLSHKDKINVVKMTHKDKTMKSLSM